jgi:hypothetical protein
MCATAKGAAMTAFLKRRWLRFSLRTLLVIMTVLAISLGLYVQSLRDRRAAIGVMEKLGGAISFRYHGPEWLRELVGDEKYFWNPNAVRFESSDPLTNDELQSAMPYLKSLGDLNYLSFRESQITNEGLKHLLPLADRLLVLDLTYTAVSDEGIIHLKQMPKLMFIRVKGGTAITPAGIAELERALPGCKCN